MEKKTVLEKKIEVKDLIISFWTNNGTVKAVRDISFSINKGETLAIVGESGSGKSVTARAILGILAGNAIVEGGEIFYDGMDLLKISEETFHDIRGNKISMIFQDPLSSLNPIMRIGRQMTEAMIINGKANQKFAKQEYNLKRKQMLDSMVAAGVTTAKQDVDKLHSIISKSSQLELAYTTARNNIIAIISDIDGVLIDIILGQPKVVGKNISEIVKDCENIYHDFLIKHDDAEILKLVQNLNTTNSAYIESGSKDQVKLSLSELKTRLEKALELAIPNFMAMSYCEISGKNYRTGTDIASMNSVADKLLHSEFLDKFLTEVEAGIEYSAGKTQENKAKALSELTRVYNELCAEKAIDPAHCAKETKLLTNYVEASIDRLEIHKDSLSYTFRSAIGNAVGNYKAAIKLSHKNRKLLSKKMKLKKDNINLELMQNNIRLVIKRVRDSFEEQLKAARSVDSHEKAVSLIDFLQEQNAGMLYKVTQRMARVRAIELMEEVGIPEPHRRYKQYPFEFSGGMRQRIVIAIALSANPDILICDEPTTALDVTIQAQILELINGLKKNRQLTVIFITHDLGVVANMADKIAVMYAGKIVEEGTSDEVFYAPAHPYTWALLSSMPDLDTKDKLEAIPGTPPNMIYPPKGDAFAARNKYAMEIDFEEQPPMFEISGTHRAATWLLHADAPKVEPPKLVTDRINRMKHREG